MMQLFLIFVFFIILMLMPALFYTVSSFESFVKKGNSGGINPEINKIKILFGIKFFLKKIRVWFGGKKDW